MPTLTPEEVQAALRKLPVIDHHDEVVEHVGDGQVRMRLPFRRAYMGRDVWKQNGGYVYSGPMVLGFADTAMYGCIVGTFGGKVLGIIQTMTTNFLRPAREADLIAHVKILRRGKRSIYLETFLFSDGDTDPVAHVTATAVIRQSVEGEKN
ncbi:MAG: PaaI family thioesterase, partial [candidate division NC10 bacterium]